MSEPTPREIRLGEVERLSRRPHAELHSKLLEVVLGAMDSLTPEEWLALARRTPERLVQSLSMSGRLAGYSERNELEVSGDLHLSARLGRMSDADVEKVVIEEGEKVLERLAMVPALSRAIKKLTDAERLDVLEALTGGTVLGRMRGVLAEHGTPAVAPA